MEAETETKEKSQSSSYYTPFQNRNKGHKSYNCFDLITVYDCATSSLCTWNSKKKSCGLNRFQYSFKQKSGNRNKQIKENKKSKKGNKEKIK